jgi:hypothetical protein
MNSGKLLRLRITAIAVLALVAGGSWAEEKSHDPSSCPLMGTKDCPLSKTEGGSSHQDHVNQNGDRVMGFEHARTTHHFLLLQDGGEIRVETNNPEDSISTARIRRHLTEVAAAFTAGDFSMPLQIHGVVPPGATTMTRLKNAILYHYEPLEAGARVLILTRDPAARTAIHEFIRFQIEDHRTGDPTDIRS